MLKMITFLNTSKAKSKTQSGKAYLTSALSGGTANVWLGSASLHSIAKHYQPLMRALCITDEMNKLPIVLLVLAVTFTLVSYDLYANFGLLDTYGELYRFMVSPVAPDNEAAMRPLGVFLEEEDFGLGAVGLTCAFLMVCIAIEAQRYRVLGKSKRSAGIVALSTATLFVNLQLLWWLL